MLQVLQAFLRVREKNVFLSVRHKKNLQKCRFSYPLAGITALIHHYRFSAQAPLLSPEMALLFHPLSMLVKFQVQLFHTVGIGSAAHGGFAPAYVKPSCYTVTTLVFTNAIPYATPMQGIAHVTHIDKRIARKVRHLGCKPHCAPE